MLKYMAYWHLPSEDSQLILVYVTLTKYFDSCFIGNLLPIKSESYFPLTELKDILSIRKVLGVAPSLLFKNNYSNSGNISQI